MMHDCDRCRRPRLLLAPTTKGYVPDEQTRLSMSVETTPDELVVP